jgi:hypothetical protein
MSHSMLLEAADTISDGLDHLGVGRTMRVMVRSGMPPFEVGYLMAAVVNAFHPEHLHEMEAWATAHGG